MDVFELKSNGPRRVNPLNPLTQPAWGVMAPVSVALIQGLHLHKQTVESWRAL